MNEVMRVSDLVFEHSRKKRWLKKPEIFRLGPIELSVQRGETVAIIGENRAGKSLLAKMLVGTIAADSGEICLNSQRYNAAQTPSPKSHHRSNDIRMIFQHSSEAMNPGITVGKILNEPLRLNTNLDEVECKQLIENTLVKVGLLREHYFFYRHMLSDGQQQRVALARAIILQPKILVADEPFAALDPSIRSQTVNLILQLQKELGLAFIFISHNLGIVRHLADKVIVMENGQIVESGKTETIFRWPQHPMTKKLILSYQSLVPQQTLR
ncbi:ATP-binding cassette domain-containing protein [Alteromonas aestuariivivens]|uniref:ATP-binding cassette domain-containing protein n=1 Tax=Alteromonas aestuariivivens TaxID=1938339 RepID=A0A3D8M5T8_9ALTE|nr:ATP-binding cassette domain-containing protein [Alteromonas aestuariivivens]RDV25113.1 ATP-binding cassette domain-containing protein [Alteromonas aestuariivivens]